MDKQIRNETLLTFLPRAEEEAKQPSSAGSGRNGRKKKEKEESKDQRALRSTDELVAHNG